MQCALSCRPRQRAPGTVGLVLLLLLPLGLTELPPAASLENVRCNFGDTKTRYGACRAPTHTPPSPPTHPVQPHKIHTDTHSTPPRLQPTLS